MQKTVVITAFAPLPEMHPSFHTAWKAGIHGSFSAYPEPVEGFAGVTIKWCF
jgi:hypothetical protein